MPGDAEPERGWDMIWRIIARTVGTCVTVASDFWTVAADFNSTESR
jgi:hypothetical protein